MPLNRAQMAALLPDNTAGEISAKDMRDIVNSCLTIVEEGDDVTDNASAVQAISDSLNYNIQTSINIDTIVKYGLYEVDTNLPAAWLTAQLEVYRYVNHPSAPNRVVQKITNSLSGIIYERAANDFDAPVWGAWVEVQGVIGDLRDVDLETKTPVLNNPLKFNGTNFIADGGDMNVSLLNVDSNIRFEQASDPLAEGLTMQIGINGQIQLVRVPQTAHTQDDLYLSDTFIQEAAAEFWRITTDVEYGAADSDALIHAVFDNNSGTDRQITFVFKADGVSVESKTYTVLGDSLSHEITISQAFSSIYPVGTVLTVEMSASKDNDVRIVGTLQNGLFRTRKTDTTAAAINSEIQALSEMVLFKPVYEYEKEGISNGGNPIVIQSNSYQAVANLQRAEIFEAGVYEIAFSATFMYSNTGRSAMFTWSIDGGSTWEDFSIEPKDSTDLKALDYKFPYVHLGGGIDLVFQAKCESSSDTLTIRYANITFERKK